MMKFFKLLALICVCSIVVAEAEKEELLLPVSKNGKYGYIDKTGKMVIKPQFDMACRFKEGYSSVKIGQKYGYINIKGKVIIPPQWGYAGDFKQGIAKVGEGNKTGYINKKGEYIWPLTE